MTDLIKDITRDDFMVQAREVEEDTKKREQIWGDLQNVKWVTGGMEGGSCWGDEARPMGGEDEPEDLYIIALLEKFAPSLTFLQFKRLMADPKLYNRYDRTNREYYGNYTEYAHRDLDLDVLFKSLKAFYE